MTARASDSCLMLDYVHVINFLLIIIMKGYYQESLQDRKQETGNSRKTGSRKQFAVIIRHSSLMVTITDFQHDDQYDRQVTGSVTKDTRPPKLLSALL